MVAVPPQIKPQSTNGETNWKTLFEEAGLDIEKFKGTESQITPPIYADEQAAWQGTLADFEDIPIRIEAAAYQGKPVYFQVVTPWEEEVIKEGVIGESAFQIRDIIDFIFNFLTFFGAIIISIFNLRAGRGDLKGAIKISIFFFILIVIHRLISYDYDSILKDWVGLCSSLCSVKYSFFPCYMWQSNRSCGVGGLKC